MLYLDSAALADCTHWWPSGILHGVTTNSALMAAAGATSLTTTVKRILACGVPEVHAQVLSEQDGEALEQALVLAGLDPRIRVKIPFVTSQGRSRAALVRQAREAGVPVNVTVCTSRAELYAALALAPEYLSVLWCRTRDAGEDPAAVVRHLAERRELTGAATKLLVGSVREPADITAALDAPCDVVTVPPAVLQRWLDHPRSVEMAGQFAVGAARLTV